MRPPTPALALIASLTLSAAGGLAQACANYSSTEVDDMAVRGALAADDDPAYHLITRQFPHHGRAYWVALERESRERLGRRDDGSLGARDDLAVALLKQGRFDEARAQLRSLDAEQPGRYRTLSNLGVLEKKAGNYQLAAGYLERALRARPGGHMGLGDYYLRACRWQGDAAQGAPSADFLGRDYAAVAGPKGVDRTYLETLIHNDRDFPDVYLVYGDLIFEDEPLLAGYAYAQARRLGHPAREVLDQRFERVRQAMTEVSGGAMHAQRLQFLKEGGLVGSQDPYASLVSSEELERVLTHWLGRFDEWPQAFERRQEELLAGGTSAASLQVVHSGLSFRSLDPGVAIPYLVEREEAKSALNLRGDDAKLALLVVALGALALVMVRVLARQTKSPRGPNKGAEEDLLT